MKKAILTLFLIASFMYSDAQNCSPDTSIKDPGIYPEFLDTGKVGSAYTHVLQILAVKDTTVTFGPNTVTATVDSIVINAINGLPPSFSYSCNPTRCVYTWQAVGCAVLNGNPDASEEGVHPLEIIVTSHARYGTIKFPVTDTIEDFVLVVQDSSLASLEKLSVVSGFKLFPNPSTNGVFQFNLNGEACRMEVIDQHGRRIWVSESNSQGVIDLRQNTPGVYYLQVFHSKGTFVRQLIHSGT